MVTGVVIKVAREFLNPWGSLIPSQLVIVAILGIFGLEGKIGWFFGARWIQEKIYEF